MIKFSIIIVFLSVFYANGQQISQFNLHLDSINKLLVNNKFAYFVGDEKGATNSKIKIVSAEYSGRIHLYDSVCSNYKPYKCICLKQHPSFNIVAVSDWKIQNGYAYLIGNNNHNIGRIYGLKTIDLYQLKTHFDALKNWCQSYENLVNKTKQQYNIKRDALPDHKLRAKKIAEQKRAEKLFNQ